MLPGVKKDLVEVERVLRIHGFQIEKLEDPTAEKLEKGLRNFLSKYGMDYESRILIYFAGHGHTEKSPWGAKMGYIVPTDAPNPQRDNSGFLRRAMGMEVVQTLVKTIYAKHVLLLFDSCFSGTIFGGRACPVNIDYKTKEPVRQFITSGSADEQVSDKSVFREMFVAALSGEGDVDKDGYVTGSELGEYLQKKVIYYSREAQHPQYGKIRDPQLDKGDFVFAVPVRTRFEIRACAVGNDRRKVEEYAVGEPVVLKVGWKIDAVGSGEYMELTVRGAGIKDYSWRNEKASRVNERYGRYCRLELSGAKHEDYYATVTVKLGGCEKQSQVYFRVLKAPESVSVDMREFMGRAAARQRLQEQWQKKLEEMRSKYSQAQKLDSGSYLSASDKVEMWRKLGRAFQENNPYSEEDDQKRRYGRERESYWEKRIREEQAAQAQAEQERQRREAKRREQEQAQRKAARLERERAQREAARLEQERASGGTVPSGFSYLRTRTYSCGGQTNTVKEYRHEKTGLEFVLLPGGSFKMGSSDGESNEKPVRQVRVDGFLLSKTEVTQAVWEKIMGNNPCEYDKGANRPVQNVSWEDCKQFCERAGLRLPTEAEWEYACRAGTETKYYWGNEMDGRYVWYSSNSSNETHPVGEKQPNAFGLYDMSGNVWEWCRDWYASDYYSKGENDNPPGPSTGSIRVVRGGSYTDVATSCRSAYRFYCSPGFCFNILGLRVAAQCR